MIKRINYRLPLEETDLFILSIAYKILLAYAEVTPKQLFFSHTVGRIFEGWNNPF